MNFFQKIPLVIANSIYPYKFYGKENIPKGKAIFSSNHFSIIDCVHYLNLTKECTYFLSKKELLQTGLYKNISDVNVNRKER